MAKQLVNPIERHVEKGVLGLAGLVLLGVIAKFLITSPNQLELGGTSVTPRTADQTVAQMAATVRERIRRANPQTELPEPLYEVWLSELDPFGKEELSVSLPATVAIGPSVPIIDPPEAVAGQAELVEVVAGDPVGLVHGRSTYNLRDADGEDLYIASNWVTVSAIFDVKKQMTAQHQAYGASRKEVVFGQPQLQRRMRRPDGSWSDDDWKDVTPYPPVNMLRVPEIKLVPDGDRFTVSRADEDGIERFLRDLRKENVQWDLLRPMMPEFHNGTDWTFPVLTAYRDVLVQDEYYAYPDDKPSANPEDRYGDTTDQRVDETLTPAQERALSFEEIERLIESAEENLVTNDAIKAYNIAGKIKEDGKASGAERARAVRLQERANYAIADIDRKLRKSRRLVSGDDKRKDEDVARQPLPFQQFWVNDADPDSVESGKTYQYRIRLVIFNRLAGQPDKFRDPYNAKVMFIPGEWSEPVEVTIEPDTVFFVASKDKRKSLVGVEFYRWFEGVWVKARVKLGEDDPVRGEDRCKVPDLFDDTKTQNTLVRFDGGATLVEIDFGRPFRERKKGSGRGGVKFASPAPACSVVLVDALGRLQERFVPTDKSHPRKREYFKRLWKPKKPK